MLYLCLLDSLSPTTTVCGTVTLDTIDTVFNVFGAHARVVHLKGNFDSGVKLGPCMMPSVCVNAGFTSRLLDAHLALQKRVQSPTCSDRDVTERNGLIPDVTMFLLDDGKKKLQTQALSVFSSLHVCLQTWVTG